MVRRRTITVALMLPSLCIGCGHGTLVPSVPSAMSSQNLDLATRSTHGYTFRTLAYPESTSTYCLGLDDRGLVVGFVGQQQSKGIEIRPPYGPRDYRVEDFPRSAGSVVTGVTTRSNTSGFWIDSKGIIRGFVRLKDIFTTYMWTPKTRTTELLALSNNDLAVGFYEDASGDDKAFELGLENGKGYRIRPPRAVSSAATGINTKGDVVGWEQLADGTMRGWFLKSGVYTVLQFPGASATEALGVNSDDEVVGIYSTSNGNTRGFLLRNPLGVTRWKTIEEPHAGANSATAVTGINNSHTIVGWYVNRAGKTDGFLATPK